MSLPTRLRLRDVRAIFRLVGEVREQGADPMVWRPHMVRRLIEIVRAHVVVSSEVHFRTTATPGVMRVVDLGWGSDADGNAWQILTERDDERPENYWLSAGQRPETADALVPVVPAPKVYGGTSFILSQCPLPHVGTVDQLGAHRAWGDELFTSPQHRLVRLLHLELGRLWKIDALNRAKDPTSTLPPRLSQTLAELLAGRSEKEIANKLELSRHTIHNYVKALHRRLGVSSRGELLAAAGQARTQFTPRLTEELPKHEKRQK